MIVWSIVLMGLGYLLSCGTTLYDVPEDRSRKPARADVAPTTRWCPAASDSKRTRSPGPSRRSCRRPIDEHRKENYWMMSQRAATRVVSRVRRRLLAGGVRAVLHRLRHLGLAAGPVSHAGHQRPGGLHPARHRRRRRRAASFPRTRPAGTSRPASCVYFGITYLFIRHLEKNNIYLKL